MDAVRWILVTGVVALAALCVLLALRLRSARRRLRGALTSQQAALDTESAKIADWAVTAERGRILREMHDVVAHSLAVMIAQADGGTYATDPQIRQRALATIADTGRAALADTRRILGALREGDAELAPVPDETGLDTLVNGVCASGTDAALIRTGRPQTLPPASGLALYRICQEALTNVVKHGGAGARVVVTQAWSDDEVALTVTDVAGRVDAAVATGEPRGYGIVGMRERAETLGGTFACGPTADGFQVRAVIPLGFPDATDDAASIGPHAGSEADNG